MDTLTISGLTSGPTSTGGTRTLGPWVLDVTDGPETEAAAAYLTAHPEAERYSTSAPSGTVGRTVHLEYRWTVPADHYAMAQREARWIYATEREHCTARQFMAAHILRKLDKFPITAEERVAIVNEATSTWPNAVPCR